MKKISILFLLVLVSVLFVQAQKFPQDGAVYRITNTVRNNAVLVENYLTNELNGGDENPLFNDLWKFTKSGEGWNIQNLLTERYIQIQTSNSKLYRTGETPAIFYVVKNNSFSKECYNIVNENGGRWGIHCEKDNDVVPWYSSTENWDGSEWTYKKIDNISDEELDAARKKIEQFSDVYNNQERVERIYLSHFEDETCTVLKSEYQSMSDEELAASLDSCGSELIAIAQKIKNNSWAKREKEFRVATYAPYANPDHWGEILKTKYYSWLNNPTGICATSGDVLYVFVGKEPKDGATLELDPIVNTDSKGNRIKLNKGLNIIPVNGKDYTYFIIYTADTRKEHVLADFDSIPIHIEGGYVNGYWDKSRHTDEDWVDITRNHAKHKYMFVKGDNMMYFMNRKVMISSDVCPYTITDAIGWWDNMVKWQQGIMGLEDYKPSRFNNRLCAISYEGDGLMSATNHVTSYVETCLHDVLAIEDIWEESGHCWGPSHEVGHVHQGAINMIGCTETSNNLFSNIVVFNLGKFVTWGDGVKNMAGYYEDAVAWSLQDIGIKMRMYFQLYLYYHVCGHDTQFYPKLFKLLREDPMKKSSGGTTNFGRYDLLHFAQKCCEAAGEDLTKFFEAWGFFYAMNKDEVSDYGDYIISSTSSMIKDAKKAMAKYPKKAAAIEFIEDRAAPSLRTDGGEGYKLEYVAGKFGEMGQYTAYSKDSIDITASGYVYTKSDNKYTMSKGKNAVGFKIYNSDSTLLTFTNFHSIELSSEIAEKDIYIVAVSANGTEVPVIDKKDGTEEEQFEALNDVLATAETVLSLKDDGSKNVGYYFESALVTLASIVEDVKAVIENKDQSVHTYGEWAKIIDKEIFDLKSNKDSRVQIHSGNIYKLTNVEYTKYTMYYENSGKISSKSGTTNPKSRQFTFISTGKENEFYISSNGKYIDYIGRSEQATATTTKKSEAIKFTV
ncbi:MAG: M60 family metallopeptidase, partial [Bacteroidaceae bacterium]|nr:M60 family metallopeptidase [Bacteroidaceae bacterium]